ncbi:hypothetical protein CsatB_010935 [Cannabis sativa]
MDEQNWSFVRPLMELNEELKCVIERAWDIHGKLNSEIEQSIKLCKVCSEHGRLCDVADQIPVEERESLIGIRDSLKQVENTLLFQHKLLCWQEKEKNEAVIHLKESRRALIELVRSYEGKSPPPNVLRELNECFGNQNIVLHSFKDGEEEANNNRWWNKYYWPKPFGFSIKCLIFLGTISCMISFSHYYRSSNPKVVASFSDSKQAQVSRSRTKDPPFNVFQARG